MGAADGWQGQVELVSLGQWLFLCSCRLSHNQSRRALNREGAWNMSGFTKVSRAWRGTGRSYRLALAVGAASIVMQSSQTHATLLNVDLRNFTSVQIQQGYASHTFTPSDVVETYLDQIAKYNPVYD